MIALLISIIIAIFGTTLFCLYLIARMKDDNKKLYAFFSITFFTFVLRFINEMFIFVFPIFPYPIMQKIQYVLYLINITLFFPLFLTFLKIRKKYKINNILVIGAVCFAIIFGILLSINLYPPQYDYDILLPINMVFFIYSTSTIFYSFIFYMVKEKESSKKEKGIPYIAFGILLMIFGDMIFSSITIEITYVTHVMGIALVFIGLEINSMIKYVNLLDLIEASVLFFDYNDKFLIMNNNATQYFKKINAEFTSESFQGKRITEVFSLLGVEDYEKKLYLFKTKRDPTYLSNKKIKLGNSDNIINIGFHPFIFNENEEITKYIILINDITQAITSQKLLEDQQAKIKLIKMLNNELRTPLYMIDGHARSLKNSIIKLKNETERLNLLNDFKVIEKDLSTVLELLKKIKPEE